MNANMKYQPSTLFVCLSLCFDKSADKGLVWRDRSMLGE